MRRFLLYAMSIAFLWSCSLEEQIKDRPEAANYLASTADVINFLNGIYSYFQAQNGYKAEAYYMMEISADHISSTLAGFAPYAQKIMQPDYSNLGGVYQNFYRMILNCNFLLEKLPDLPINDDFRRQVEGETRFFRALAYFDLVRWFGGVPLRYEATNSDTEFFGKRNDVQEVYAFVFNELLRVNALLENKSSASIAGLGLTNKGASQAVLSKAYLTFANHLDLRGEIAHSQDYYKLAGKYADSVIFSGEYQLASHFADLFDVTKEVQNYQQEVVFGIRFTRDPVGTGANRLGSQYGIRYMPSSIGGVTGQQPNGNGLEYFKVQPWFFDVYSRGEYDGDYRSEVTFLTQWTHHTLDREYVTYPYIPQGNQAAVAQPFLKKYIDGDGYDLYNHENDFYVIRLAELFLIKAEVENELNGPTDIAYQAFNELRRRARNANGELRLTPLDLELGLSKEQFRLKVFDERGLEFVGEGKRWFDLVRMKSPTGTTMYEYMFSTLLPNLPQGLPTYNSATKTWLGGRTERLNIVPYHARRLLYPIPQREIDMNPLMEQNSGYN